MIRFPADWIRPDWPAPPRVRAVMTTRVGGVSAPPFDSFNPATHVGDEPAAVARNRALLAHHLPASPFWLNQVHGHKVALFGDVDNAAAPDADASVSRMPAQVCCVLTADCLPVLFCDEDAQVVAAAHAGWRGLAAGVLEETVRAMQAPSSRILAWMGAAIGPGKFEVGAEVREIFISQHPAAERAFLPSCSSPPSSQHYLADIYELARIRLAAMGVTRVYGGGECTVSDQRRFYSYRRDGRTGRMASLIWLEAEV